MLMFKKTARFIACMLVLLTGSLSASPPPDGNEADLGQLQFRLRFDPAVYSITKYKKPPQLAIWLEQPATGVIRTVWVSDCTGAGTWRGKTICPVSLPCWVSRYNQESGTKGDPSKERPVADAISQPTPKDEFQVSADVPAGSVWDYWIEVNVSGDYNEAFPVETSDGRKDQAGNGQPSLVYRGNITAVAGAKSEPKLLGRTEQHEATDRINESLDGITTAKGLLSKIDATCVSCGAQNSSLPTTVPGVVIDHQAASTGTYVGSPSIALLPDGSYVASHDIFGPKSKYNQTKVFRSCDQGRTWSHASDVQGALWNTLFVHGQSLYLMGASGRYGNTVIRRSDDGGLSWTDPEDEQSGLLLDDGGYHCSPQPVLVHAGRIWRAMEDNRGPAKGWGKHFRAFMMSAPVDADLLKASSWTISNRVACDTRWADGKFGGWLEGNAVLSPAGEIVNILRVEFPEGGGKAAIVRISEDGRTATFDPESDIIDMPGGCTKFTIRFDPESKYYWTLSNYMPPRHLGNHPGATRNTLALVRSRDLRDWEVRSIVAYHPDTKKHGFQYVDWLFDGDDIVAAARTAFDDGLGGAHNYHDANYLTFHRLKRFRELNAPDLPPLQP